MTKRKTNAQTVTHLMDYAKTGPVVQCFIMDAIAKQADAVAACPIDELRNAFGSNPFITPEVWQQAALEIQEALKKHHAQ